MINFASHPTIYYGCKWVSADFTGVTRAVIQQLYGANIPVLYLQGSCGNIAPFDYAHDDDWGRGVDGCRRVGTILAAEAIKIMSGNRPCQDESIDIQLLSQTIDIPFRDISEDDVADAKARWDKISLDKKTNLDASQLFQDLEQAAHINIMIALGGYEVS